MLNLMIEGATRIGVGAAQGYRGIAIRDELVDDCVNGPSTPQMVMAYELMPDELVRLVYGAPVLLSIVGTSPPPHLLEVGEAPDGSTEGLGEETRRYVDGVLASLSLSEEARALITIALLAYGRAVLWAASRGRS